MAGKKHINVFSVSFLDLLSGALAAVIILFIIIPKTTVEQQEVNETLEQIDVNIEEIQDILETVSENIPAEIYQQIEEQIDQLRNLNEELRQQVEQLQMELTQTISDLEECEQERLRQEENIEELTEQLESAQAQIEHLEQQIAESPGISDKFFGLDAELGVVAEWSEDLDVDLWLRDNNTDQWCSYQNRETHFGILSEDVRSQPEGQELYELIYQRTLRPGTYDIWVHMYSTTGTATVSGYAILNPGRYNEQKITYGPITLQNRNNRPPSPPRGGSKVGTLTVTETSISLER